jgi:hypothetical protein
LSLAHLQNGRDQIDMAVAEGAYKQAPFDIQQYIINGCLGRAFLEKM